MPIDLDELERLEREATPGPWHWKHNDIVQRDEAGKFVADVAGMYYDDDGYPNWGADNAANTELIIALRNAAPALFAELRAARERIAEMRRVLGIAQDALDRMMGDSDLDGDNSLEMRAMKAIASTLEEAPNAD